MSMWIGIAIVMVLLSACGGTKKAADVVTDLERMTGKLESYHTAGTMVLHTGQEPQTYGVVVSYQKPHYYRIALTNEAKDITQVVLRNDDGVFVLTPHLNKSFRFQSDWPKNQGQAYLYETLAQSIISDEQRQLITEENTYVFDVMANYQNASFVRQRIWLNKDNYAPKRVTITDGDEHEMVTVTFDSFDFNKKFDSGWFDMQKNMTSISIQSVPVVADENNPNMTDNLTDPNETSAAGIIYPSYVPDQVTESQPSVIRLGEREAIMLRYTGAYNYTLVQSKSQEERMVSNSYGTVVDIDLGETVGIWIGEDQRTLMWTNDGVDYRLASGDLPYAEMVNIARSLFGQTGK